MVIYWPSWHIGSNFRGNLFVVINHEIFNKSCESQRTFFAIAQGGRSCMGAQVAPAEKFGLLTKILRPNIRKLKFVAIYALFGDLWAKKNAFLGQKQCFLGKKCTITWYILHVLLS